MKAVTRDWNWWAYLFRVTHRGTIPSIERYDDELVAFMVETLDLRPGNRVLDLGCGSGVHALRLAQRGIQVVGLDIAPRLVEYATSLVDEAGVAGATFVVGDMREPQAALGDLGSQGFHAVSILSTSFGIFDEAGNRRVLEAARRMLVPGGCLLLDLADPAEMMIPHDQWWSELDGGFLLMEAWYNPATCVRHGTFRYVDSGGNLYISDGDEEIRVYALPELMALLRDTGLPLRAAYGGTMLPPRTYGVHHHERMILIARKPSAGLDPSHERELASGIV